MLKRWNKGMPCSALWYIWHAEGFGLEKGSLSYPSGSALKKWPKVLQIPFFFQLSGGKASCRRVNLEACQWSIHLDLFFFLIGKRMYIKIRKNSEVPQCI